MPVLLAVLGGVSFDASSVLAAGTPAFSIHAVAEPSSFSAGDAAACVEQEKCDRYQEVVLNVGGAQSSGPVTLTDTLPAGITFREVVQFANAYGLNGDESGEPWECSASENSQGRWVVTCSFRNRCRWVAIRLIWNYG